MCDFETKILTHLPSLSSGDQTKIKNAWNEDNLKLLKLEYLSNHWSDLLQILILSEGAQTNINEMKKTYNERGLKII